MLKRSTIFVALSAVGLLLAGNTFAAYDSDGNAINSIKDTGIYVEGNVGFANINEDTGLPTTKTDTDGLAINLNAGYKANKNLSFEVGVTRLSDEDFGTVTIESYDYIQDKTVDETVKLDAKNNYMYDIAVRAILPLDNGVSIFGKFGLGYFNHEAVAAADGRTVTDTVGDEFVLLGAGVGYNFTPNFAINLQGIFTPKTEDKDLPVTFQGYLGLNYLF
jgi:opacity protein-like surface antigen